MVNFTNVTQKIVQAAGGSLLVDIVDYTISIEFLGWAGVSVLLRDRATNQVLCTHLYIDILFGGTRSGSLPDSSSTPTSLVMGSQPMYLQIEVWGIGIAGSPILGDSRVLAPIALPGVGGGGGGGGWTVPPDQVPLVIGLGGLAVVSVAWVVLNRRRGRRRRR